MIVIPGGHFCDIVEALTNYIKINAKDKQGSPIEIDLPWEYVAEILCRQIGERCSHGVPLFLTKSDETFPIDAFHQNELRQ